jgi:hypothetical protein
MNLTTENAQIVVNAITKALPNAAVKTNRSNNEINSVTATIQGKLNGNLLMQIVEAVKSVKTQFSVYRSGTGLTIKFE